MMLLTLISQWFCSSQVWQASLTTFQASFLTSMQREGSRTTMLMRTEKMPTKRTRQRGEQHGQHPVLGNGWYDGTRGSSSFSDSFFILRSASLYSNQFRVVKAMLHLTSSTESDYTIAVVSCKLCTMYSVLCTVSSYVFALCTALCRVYCVICSLLLLKQA